jgi:hypothetical protein
MKTVRAMLVRLAGLFRRKQLESEMNEELRAHFDALIERNLAAGMSLDEARHAALRTFGGVAQIAERARDERRSAWAITCCRMCAMPYGNCGKRPALPSLPCSPAHSVLAEHRHFQPNACSPRREDRSNGGVARWMNEMPNAG